MEGSAPESTYENAFEDLGLAKKVVKPLGALGISKPTPIQKQAIPLVLKGHDVMGLAQTGTGKTAAFGLPLVHKLLADGGRPEPKGVRSLILAPTRELVNQIADNLRLYVKKTPIWVSSVVGGQSINSQMRHLGKGTDILVATPGRLLDLVERKAVRLETAQYLVLDEADQMLDLGFIHALRKIAKLLGQPRQTLLFSATMPANVEELSRAYLNDPVRVEVSPPGKAADKVRQCVHYIGTKQKADLLRDLMSEREDDLSLVFARTKHGAEKLMKHLVACGFAAVSIHGNKSQGQRDRALKAFKTGEARVLVATDVAARGIDIPGVSHVYNFNLPEVPENYVHRIGRTARAGRGGEAVALCAPDERKLLRQVERLMGIDIRVESGEGGPHDMVLDPPKRGGGGGGRGNRSNEGKPNKKSRLRAAEAGGAAKPSAKKHPRRGKDGDGPTPSGDQPRTQRPRNKPSGGKPTGGKPGGGRPSGGRPSGGKPGGGKPRTKQRAANGERKGGGNRGRG